MDKGANWHKWDLHVHTASSYDYKYKATDADELLVEAWKANELSAVAITDHFKIDVTRIKNIRNIINLKKYNISVFLGVELRTDKGDTNIHVILIFDLNADLDILADDFNAIMLRLKAKPSGSYTDENVYWDYLDILEFSRSHNAIISIHAGKKANGIDRQIQTYGLPHAEAIKEEYDESVHIYEVSKLKDIEDYHKFVFKDARERPVIICSDNHDPRDYQLKENLWIKSIISFEGLKQAIIHSSERVFVGDTPLKIRNIEKNPEKYIKRIRVKKKKNSINADNWFDIDLYLNNGLTTIIGNKGSGKSALADFIGFIGKSANIDMFSFLSKNRFCKEDKNYNLDYEGYIKWLDNEKNTVTSFDISSNDGVQMVRYLPQRYIEETCNNLDKQFQNEIDKVIFSYVDERDKGSAIDLKDLISTKEESLKIDSLRIKEHISSLNDQIITLEKKTDIRYKKEIKSKVDFYSKELERHLKNKPKEIKKPSLNDETTKVGLEKIEEFNSEISKLEQQIIISQENLRNVNSEKNKLLDLKNAILRIENEINDINERADIVSSKYSIVPKINIEIKSELTGVNSRLVDIEKQITQYNIELNENYEKKEYTINTPIYEIINDYSNMNSLYGKIYLLKERINRAKDMLSKPQKEYQEYLEKMNDWELKRKTLVGSEIKVDSLKFFKAELEYIDNRLNADLIQLKSERNDNIQNLYLYLVKKKKILDDIYAPIEQKLANILKEIDDKVVFKSTIHIDNNFTQMMLGYINQRVQSKFKGKSTGIEYVDSLIRKYNFDSCDDTISFINDILDAVSEDESKADSLVSSRRAFYDLITNLEYLDVGFSLKMGEKDLEQLSPGEKGTVLLIFYLALDKEELPLIIDQPEDNLDNQSVYSKLVPCVLEAKKNRQVILITHNPNLAIACDSELIVYSEKCVNENRIIYHAGAIEEKYIKDKIVDILEGTMPAFDLRTDKYKEQFFNR